MASTTFRTIKNDKWIDDFIFKAKEVGDVERLKAQVSASSRASIASTPRTRRRSASGHDENFQFIDTFMLGFRIFLGWSAA